MLRGPYLDRGIVRSMDVKHKHPKLFSINQHKLTALTMLKNAHSSAEFRPLNLIDKKTVK